MLWQRTWIQIKLWLKANFTVATPEEVQLFRPVLDFWLPELKDDKSALQATWFVVVCYNSIMKPKSLQTAEDCTRCWEGVMGYSK